ncbi:glutaminyl-tRNA synthase (glutamine-hydrolyzing) subunit A [Candidatus Berkelbacteria bacterium RIFCSPLOWO2_01_FULL_50_28]|uniref:Glutamyl-tRNA(Gln) amidotransferase subunit A n=1 Tax=Candidatus Berkelbacteria bacterium RIFCSPLOWO2_01_FULL_50_28 TaxID=1797471 RepID=A0A1F5EBC1_9BACT|nr:MAG: glutaminyl-tRNA synthase (glutamine-hydrolyzing) subunit A [Candidatus Berkelbacteria bacterium RIFCSPHIGHO2_01_FULL_50_36]OGD64685.1 MAG: glutaminyl-tRNA synthase (glutamine-hydrolyzing) subunit A [Candidatus Berkelbacteria bacterium RIFCSPLOWO2_01_FULL_50_28]
MSELNAFLHTDLKPISPSPLDSLELARGNRSLEGMKVAIKDNIAVADWPLTAGSKILDGYISPYDATVITKLKRAGATLIGKTNLDEFAMGSSTETSAFGPALNPWDNTRVPGGSSGGSAAAVAAGLCDVALGSDTAGSIRQPAAFCGVTGLKPTYGSVSRYGLVALASSFDVIGAMAYKAEDVERVFAAMSGQDEFDQTTFSYKYKPEGVKVDGLKIGLPRELWELEIDPEIKKATQELVKFFVDRGAKISDVSLPSLPLALPAYYVILPAEASANLARFDGIRYKHSEPTETLLERYTKTRSVGFGAEVKRRILLGTFALSVGHYDAYYQQAVNVQRKIEQEHQEVFEKVDVLISPTTPSLPFKIGEKIDDPIEMYKSDLLTVGANLAGVPAISLPVGFSKSGLPIGAQIIAKRGSDNVVLDLAKIFQAETEHHNRRPEPSNHQ